MFLQLNSEVKSLTEIMFLQDHQYFRGWVFPVSVCGLLICRVLLPTCWPSMTPSKIAISMNFIPSSSHSLLIKMMNLWKFCYFYCFCTKKPKGKCCYMFISFSVLKLSWSVSILKFVCECLLLHFTPSFNVLSIYFFVWWLDVAAVLGYSFHCLNLINFVTRLL